MAYLTTQIWIDSVYPLIYGFMLALIILNVISIEIIFLSLLAPMLPIKRTLVNGQQSEEKKKSNLFAS